MFNPIDDLSDSNQYSRKRTILLSLVVHAGVILILLVLPLIFYEALPEGLSAKVLAYIPTDTPPPPPPMPESQPMPETHSTIPTVVKLLEFTAPKEIPQGIPEAPDAGLPEISVLQHGMNAGPPERGAGSSPGFFGVRGILNQSLPPPPPPPEAKAREPLVVSQGVIASKLIHRVNPEYPELARRARVQGTVLLQILLDEEGVVREVEVMRGHPLLVQSAVDALRQWRYSPTFLNGEPVPVKATVTVRFTLR